jgi:hypothetical protein
MTFGCGSELDGAAVVVAGAVSFAGGVASAGVGAVVTGEALVAAGWQLRQHLTRGSPRGSTMKKSYSSLLWQRLREWLVWRQNLPRYMRLRKL